MNAVWYRTTLSIGTKNWYRTAKYHMDVALYAGHNDSIWTIRFWAPSNHFMTLYDRIYTSRIILGTAEQAQKHVDQFLEQMKNFGAFT